ncbi:MAG: von Willebrand factor type A domain-containing protein [Clostridia bacterium]|nr:von Willebrand factor type A domain-containing protein [Clostridia bacterium]
MKNKIKLISALLLVALMLSLASCAAATAPGAMKNDGAYYSPELEGGMSGEEYTEIVENPFINTAEKPDSYFSIDANTASYPNLRRYINSGYGNIPKDAVRVEEMLNYFSYDYETPKDDSILALTSSVFDTPYNEETKLLTIGLAAKEIEFKNISNNLVFLIDVSGSMYSEDKLPLVQQSFLLLLDHLNPTDRVSIVTYAGSDKVLLRGAYGYEKQKIAAIIEELSAGGSTAGSAGLRTAYKIAKECFIQGGNNRIILATDGDLNVGITSIFGLEEFVANKAKSGVYLSVFGFGTGNIKSDKMESLALKGNGTYSYIDSVREARRALVEQIGGTMITVAKDVKAGIVFNPEYVESYRLIGYENKILTQEEFEDSNTDAGELGSGHTVTVVYEIVLTNKEFVEGENLADVKIKYKPTENVGSDAATEQELTLAVGTESYHAEPTETDAFVAAVVEFALVLRDSEYKGTASLSGLIERLNALDLANDEFKQEFKELVKKYYESRPNQQ